MNGWDGQGICVLPYALQNSHLKLFYERNLEAMSDLQTSEGQFRKSPPIGGGFGGITCECASDFLSRGAVSAVWGYTHPQPFLSGNEKIYDLYGR